MAPMPAKRPERLRILLDQGFPKPPGFDPAAVDRNLEDEAQARCGRDPRDWPAVASALAMSAGIWTNDNDFLGTGVPTWTTATLQAWLDRQPPAEHDR